MAAAVPAIELMMASPELLRLVTDRIDEDDAFAVALVSRAMHEAILARTPPPCTPPCYMTTLAGVVASPTRVAWASELGAPLGAPACAAAARLGDVAMLKELAQRYGSLPDTTALDAAASAGHLDACQYLHGLAGCAVDEGVWCEAARGGHVHVLRWLCTLRSARVILSPRVYEAAAAGGSMAACAWLSAKGCPRDQRACEAAARNGSVDMLEFLRGGNVPCPIGAGAAAAAAEADQVSALAWLFESAAMPAVRTPLLMRAAQHGARRVLAWLRARGAVAFVPAACEFAARGGQLDTLRWLLADVGVEPQMKACREAARGGHLGCLRLLHARCACDATVCSAAASGGHVHILRFLCDEAGLAPGRRATVMAARAGSADTLRWLNERGHVDLRDAMVSEHAAYGAAYGAHLGVLEWLHAHGALVVTDALFQAAAKGRAVAHDSVQLESAPRTAPRPGSRGDIHASRLAHVTIDTRFDRLTQWLRSC